MKYILILLSTFISLMVEAQITIRGAKKTEIIETNADKKEVKEINNINFTKTQEERVKPSYIYQNEIKNSTTKLSNEAIEINIINPEKLSGEEKKQIVVDLNQAKKAVDSVKYLKNPEYALEEDKQSYTPLSQKENAISATNETINNSTSEIKTEEIKTTEEFNLVNKTQSKESQSGIYIESKSGKPIVTKNTETIETKNTEAIKPNIELEKQQAITTTNNSKAMISNEKSIEINKKADSKTSIGNLNNLESLEQQNKTSLNSDVKNDKEDLNENSISDPRKGSWSMGLKFGIPAIIGDVNSRAGYGFSLNVQKAIGHLFALRFEALALETKGLNNRRINNTFHNYKTRFTDYTLQGVFTLNNLSFYNKQPKVLYNIAFGGGLATRYTWTDVLTESGIGYNYDNISLNNPADIYKEINAIRDKNYETSISKDGNKMSINNTDILPTIMLGMGIDIKLSKALDLNLATRFSYHFDDNLDGLKIGNKVDWMSFTSLGLTYKFGSKNKSLLWTNPVYSKIEEINDLKKKVDEGDLLKDEDKDGIADIFDQDLNTPEKVAVDSRGVPSDLDKDGVPDYQDAEPFTPLGAQVNEKGIAIDTDQDGIADILDQEKNTLPGASVDANGKTIVPSRNSANDLNYLASKSDFDLIFFDENSATVKKEFYSNLYKITRYLQGNPSSRIEIIGHTDVLAGEDYNLNLSEKRANAVYSMLIEMFKVPARNLTTSFKGENQPIIEGLPERKDRKFDAAYYINRRVEFKIVK